VTKRLLSWHGSICEASLLARFCSSSAPPIVKISEVAGSSFSSNSEDHGNGLKLTAPLLSSGFGHESVYILH